MVFGFLFDSQPEETVSTADKAGAEDGAPFVLHCDYDENCMELFKQIEAENWANIIKFMDSGGSWPGFSIMPDWDPETNGSSILRERES